MVSFSVLGVPLRSPLTGDAQSSFEAVLVAMMEVQSILVVLEHQVKEIMVVKRVLDHTLAVVVAVVLTVLVQMVLVIRVVTVVMDIIHQ